MLSSPSKLSRLHTITFFNPILLLHNIIFYLLFKLHFNTIPAPYNLLWRISSINNIMNRHTILVIIHQYLLYFHLQPLYHHHHHHCNLSPVIFTINILLLHNIIIHLLFKLHFNTTPAPCNILLSISSTTNFMNRHTILVIIHQYLLYFHLQPLFHHHHHRLLQLLSDGTVIYTTMTAPYRTNSHETISHPSASAPIASILHIFHHPNKTKRRIPKPFAPTPSHIPMTTDSSR